MIDPRDLSLLNSRRWSIREAAMEGRNSPMVEDVRLALEKVMLSEAAEIAAAREKCRILHGTADIKAAGDEVEICVRDLLRRRLGHDYYVGHGHIIDSTGRVSPQLDVIIADASVIPALFRSENGTEFFQYESVYAIGEIKATYRKSSNHIAQFMETRDRVLALTREDVSARFIRTRSGGVTFGDGVVVEGRHGSQNTLFTFMLFADSGDFDKEHANAVYSERLPGDLPNVTCLLNLGLITYVEMTAVGRGQDGYDVTGLLNHPSRPKLADGRTFAWTLFSNGEGESRALSWGVLYAMIVEHLMGTTVKPVSPISYMQQIASSQRYTCLTEPDSRGFGKSNSFGVVDTM